MRTPDVSYIINFQLYKSWWLVWSIMGVQTVYIRYIHTIQCYLLIRSNKFVLGRDIPSVGDFILKYSENFDYIKVRKGAPRLVASLHSKQLSKK